MTGTRLLGGPHATGHPAPDVAYSTEAPMLFIFVVSEYANVDVYDSWTGEWSEVWIDYVYVMYV